MRDEEQDTLAGIKEQLKRRGLEKSVVHEIEPSLRTGSQVAFSPSLVDEIVGDPKEQQ
ncbi:hypothetical protein [Streptacidiphilus neutrinimicus]|uniref:hypothetical protein n=1 Tax=Streptacidiphilus neutrinimicus TaxID=105420 RepID=UPI000A7AC342|nr:hypothetical protein [Streptacidiphilus neutrinimicus]